MPSYKEYVKKAIKEMRAKGIKLPLMDSKYLTAYQKAELRAAAERQMKSAKRILFYDKTGKSTYTLKVDKKSVTPLGWAAANIMDNEVFNGKEANEALTKLGVKKKK